MFHNWRRLVKYPRLALEEVNVTVITMYCRYKQRTIFFHLIQRFALDQNLIRNASGSQVTQSLIAMQIIDLLKTQPTDLADSMIASHPMQNSWTMPEFHLFYSVSCQISASLNTKHMTPSRPCTLNNPTWQFIWIWIPITQLYVFIFRVYQVSYYSQYSSLVGLYKYAVQ